jgi:predicted transcriptional regulator
MNAGNLESAKTQAVIADQIKKQKEEEKRTLEELVEKYKNVQSASQKA